MITPDEDEKRSIKEQFEATKAEYEELGGWQSFKNGEWLYHLIQRCFRNYFDRANVTYFQQKYGTSDQGKIESKLISVAKRNAAILGALTGSAVSADEIVAILTLGEGGLGVPANVAIALAAAGAEAIFLVRIQLQLVANLGKLYNVKLDPDDPEDILTILSFAIGGVVADAAGKAGMKVGGEIAARATKEVIKKEVLAALKRFAAKHGFKILQKQLVKYSVPIASIGIGATWNYFTTRTVGRLAAKHFQARLRDLNGCADSPMSPDTQEEGKHKKGDWNWFGFWSRKEEEVAEDEAGVANHIFAEESVYLGHLGGYDNPGANSTKRDDHFGWASGQTPEHLTENLAWKYCAQFDRQARISAEAAHRFYGDASARLASYGNDLGNPGANGLDAGSHANWARHQSHDTLRGQIADKVRKLMLG